MIGRKPSKVYSKGKNSIKVEDFGESERSAQEINRKRGKLNEILIG
jgi:hypothetical protein